MANELTDISNELAVLGKNLPANELFRPLEREIELLETAIAGTSHLKDKSVLETLKPGTVLDLKREPQNPYDPMAVLVMKDGKKAGYLPQCDNEVFARLLNAGKDIAARVTRIGRRDKYWDIEITVIMREL